jgi:hypothetical protein
MDSQDVENGNGLWERLPAAVAGDVLNRLQQADSVAVATACWQWRIAVQSSLTTLAPRSVLVSTACLYAVTCSVQWQQQQHCAALRRPTAAAAAAVKEHHCERSSARLAGGQRYTLSIYACMDTAAHCGQHSRQGSQSSPARFLSTTVS